MYSPAKFGEMIGKSVKILQRWDTEGTLVACRIPKTVGITHMTNILNILG